MKSFPVLLLLLLFTFIAQAQQADAPRDTSFTVYSSYQKERKKFPFIEIAKTDQQQGVQSKNNVVYKTMGNRVLSLDIFFPSQGSKNKYPGVLLIHGGGWKSGDKSQCIPVARQLAAQGYVAVAVEYRLSTEAKYPAAVLDVKDAIRWMRAHAAEYHLNKAKIAAMGFSSGGQMAALMGTTNGLKRFDTAAHGESSDVQAIVDVDGILAFKHPESAEGAAAAAWLGGTYEENPAAWHEASALTHTDKNTVPILYINSSLPRFHAGREDMIKKLDSVNIYSEVHTLPDTPHPFWLFHPWFEPTMKFTVNFLDKVLKEKGN